MSQTRKLKVKELKMIHFSYIFPSSGPAWSITIKPEIQDVKRMENFIEDFKEFHRRVEQKYREALKQKFEYSRSMTEITDVAKIIHVGRKENARKIIEIYPMPAAMYTAINHIKARLDSFVYNNAMIIRSKPKNFVLATEFILPELVEAVKDANKQIQELNLFMKKIWQEEEPIIEQLIKENELGEGTAMTKPMPLHEIWVKTIPIYFSSKIFNEVIEKDPETADVIKDSFKEFVEEILKSSHSEMKYMLTRLFQNKPIKKSAALKRVDRLANRMKSVGLDSVAEEFKRIYLEVLERPSELKKYVEYDRFVNEINARIITAVEME